MSSNSIYVINRDLLVKSFWKSFTSFRPLPHFGPSGSGHQSKSSTSNRVMPFSTTISTTGLVPTNYLSLPTKEWGPSFLFQKLQSHGKFTNRKLRNSKTWRTPLLKVSPSFINSISSYYSRLMKEVTSSCLGSKENETARIGPASVNLMIPTL